LYRVDTEKAETECISAFIRTILFLQRRFPFLHGPFRALHGIGTDPLCFLYSLGFPPRNNRSQFPAVADQTQRISLRENGGVRFLPFEYPKKADRNRSRTEGFAGFPRPPVRFSASRKPATIPAFSGLPGDIPWMTTPSFAKFTNTS
jgi:hypothetical protein